MHRMRAAVAFLLLFLGLCPPASAHSNRSAGSGEGLAFPSASHGELLVLADYRGEILGLARRVVDTDPDFRRLMNYAAIEFSYCGWGLAPGAIGDETSPFNECSHAYLSAERALLLHMRTMPSVGEKAGELASRIDADMVRNGASLIGCVYSGEGFNTADFVTPHWENVWTHGPSAATAGGVIVFGAALSAACFVPWPVMRRRVKQDA